MSRINNNKRTKRNSNKNNNAIIPNQIYAKGFPRQMKVKLTYVESLAAATTNGLNFDRVFNLNSGFDPYRTGTGHQPRAWDQWSALYNRYRVDRTEVSVSWTNAPSDGAIVSLYANNDATNITLIDDIIELPFSKWAPIQLGGPAITLKAAYNLHQLTGVSKMVYESDDRYSALTSSDPAEILALHAGFNCKTAFTTNSYTVLNYYVTFFDPIQIAQS